MVSYISFSPCSPVILQPFPTRPSHELPPPLISSYRARCTDTYCDVTEVELQH